MFNKINSSSKNAEEVKNRILAYAALKSQAEPQAIWPGELSKYILNLRLSGVVTEKKVLQAPQEYWRNLGRSSKNKNAYKFIYYESDVFLQEYQNIDDDTFVEKMYQVYLQRNADPGGKSDNLQQLKQGNSRNNLVASIRVSEEGHLAFLKATSCLNNQVFLDLIYRIFLDHKPSSDLKNKDLKSLHQGQSRHNILILIQNLKQSLSVLDSLKSSFYLSNEEFCQSCENLSNDDFVDKIYHVYLKREADPGGKEDKLQKLQQDISRKNILADLRQSEEAFNVFLTITSCFNNQQFIEAAYLTYLRDQPNSESQVLSVQKLESGESRHQIIRSLLNSNP